MMNFKFKAGEYNPSSFRRAINIFLLALIIAGITLLCTQKIWVPKVVQYILVSKSASISPELIQSNGTMDTTFDGRNSSFTIDGEIVTLIDGVAETSVASNSATKIVTRYFGNEATGDLTGDGKPEVAFLVSREGGGTGTFFYAVVAIKNGEVHKLTNAFLIGDRIAPQSTYIPENSKELQVNFAERRPGEPASTPPSQGATLLLKVTEQGVLEGLMQ
jgi:hypothetical protein